jgi:hypothetical protein
MRIPYERLRALLRGIALGSGLVASVAATIQIPAACGRVV